MRHLVGLLLVTFLAGCGVTPPSPSPTSGSPTPALAPPASPAPTPSAPSSPSTVPAATPTPTLEASPVPLPSAGGTCASSQFVPGKATSTYSFSSFGSRTVDVWQPLRNAGGRCVLRLPTVIAVASATGPFQLVPVENGGNASSFDIKAGQSLNLVLRGWWWVGWTSDTATPPPPPPCANPITDVTRVEFPFASGAAQIDFDTAWREVCSSPASVSVTVR
jgi:hypothetical protein